MTSSFASFGSSRSVHLDFASKLSHKARLANAYAKSARLQDAYQLCSAGLQTAVLRPDAAAKAMQGGLPFAALRCKLQTLARSYGSHEAVLDVEAAIAPSSGLNALAGPAVSTVVGAGFSTAVGAASVSREALAGPTSLSFTGNSSARSSSSDASKADAPSNSGDAPASPEHNTPAGSSGSSSSSSEDKGVSVPPLTLTSGAAMLPHPDKADRGGEDSFFISEQQPCLGVADGVGGWADVGIDAGTFARLLMAHAEDESVAEGQTGAALSPQAILERAYHRMDVCGSCTACVLCLNGTTLSCSNLGDSGFALVRNGEAVFQTPPQQHNFNFPYQLGPVDSMSDKPQAAMRYELQLQPGDIIISGTDGLWDNVFSEEAATIVSKCIAKGETAEVAAQVLCRYARMRAVDTKYNSPFSYAAVAAGYPFLGGKLDDITVLVSVVSVTPRPKL